MNRSDSFPAGRRSGRIVAVCTSEGGIPKQPRDWVRLTATGAEGDEHDHAKHNRPDRAICLMDLEILQELAREGFPLTPGAAGENLTVEGLGVQRMAPGDVLAVGDALLRLEQPRKPCFVLDAIDIRLKEAIAGRCGYMASVLRGGVVRPGQAIGRVDPEGVEPLVAPDRGA